MPSERSSASAMTGLNALRTKARSISLQTCIRPFCRTESVIGSTVMFAILRLAWRLVSGEDARRRSPGPDRCRSERAARCSSDGDDEIADRIDLDPVPRLDHRRAIELLDDRRPREARVDGQTLAQVH